MTIEVRPGPQTSHHRPPTSFDGLLAYNAMHAEAFKRLPFFTMIVDGTLNDASRRDVFLACLQRVSRAFQTMMLTRQAACVDPKFSAVFARHMAQELGHDKLLEQRPNAWEMQDPLLEAVLTWFIHAMLVRDNVEKTALVHLVFEVAGDHFHALAAPSLARHVPSSYFETHADLDEGHAAMGAPLLSTLDARACTSLAPVVDVGWDMIGAMTDRILALVHNAA